MPSITAAPADITKLKTTQERLLFHKDGKGLLWFFGWEGSPVIYRHDGSETICWTLPAGSYLSQHDAFASAPDGTVYFGGAGHVIYTIRKETLDTLPPPTLTGPGAEHQHPYAMAFFEGGLYATFANTESRTKLHRYRDGSWTELGPTYRNLSQLDVFADRLVARELFAELVTLDGDGAPDQVLLERADGSTSKVQLGASRFVVYGSRKLAVRDKDGELLGEVISEESVACVGHAGDDQFVVVDEKGGAFRLDTNDLTSRLVKQPYKKALKVVSRIEVDGAGQCWFRQTAARKAYFTVADPQGKLKTIKNK